MTLPKDELARLVGGDIVAGSFVNLGIDQPTSVAEYIDPRSGIVLHTENGMLNMRSVAQPGREDPDLTNAGRRR